MNFIITTLFIASIISVANCGDYYRIDGRTYFTSYPEKSNWYQAKRFCTLLGTRLIDIPVEAEHVRIQSVIEQTETRYYLGRADWWTSGTDQGSEGKFYWDTTGSEFEFTNWAPGQPSNTNWGNATENCLQLGSDETHEWNDIICMHDAYFICRDPFIANCKGSCQA